MIELYLILQLTSMGLICLLVVARCLIVPNLDLALVIACVQLKSILQQFLLTVNVKQQLDLL